MEAVATLKAELVDLNLKCQQARDNEVRYALQRSRLEAERASLLVRIVEATGPVGLAPTAVSAPYHVVVQQAAAKPIASTETAYVAAPGRRPTIPDMVLAALRSAPDSGLKAGRIIEAIRNHQHVPVKTQSVYRVLNDLRKAGRIQFTQGNAMKLCVFPNGNGLSQ